MHTYVYSVDIDQDEEGGFIVTVPALPGCVTYGETYEHAVANAEECIAGFIESLRKTGDPIPQERHASRMTLRVEVPTHASA